jgi:hypothetical protein
VADGVGFRARFGGAVEIIQEGFAVFVPVSLAGMTGGTLVSVAGEGGAVHRFGKEGKQAAGCFCCWAGSCPRGPFLFSLISFLFFFCYFC